MAIEPPEDPTKCGAWKKGRSARCTRPAGWGTPFKHGRCKLHGGLTPTHVRASQRRMQTEALAEAVAVYGLPVDVDPREALLQEVHRTAGHVAWLTERIRELDPDALIWGKTKYVNKVGGQDEGVTVEEGASVHVWLDLYHRERKHLLEVSKAAIAAGIEERKVRIAEQMGQQLAAVITAVLTDLGHRPDDPRVRGVVVRHLALVSNPAM